MKEFLSNWNFMRVMRLGLGIAITVQSALAHETIMTAIGLLFTSMAIFNIGCCGVGACSTPVRKSNQPLNDIDYEEVR